HLAGLHFFSWIRPQQGQQSLRVLATGIQPAVLLVFGNNHRHPVVNGSRHFVWFSRNDRARPDIFTVGRNPVLVEPGESKAPAAFEADKDRLPDRSSLPPFIEAISYDQASPLLKCFLERGFLVNRLSSGID